MYACLTAYVTELLTLNLQHHTALIKIAFQQLLVLISFFPFLPLYHFCTSMAKLKIGQMRNPRAKKTSTLGAKYFEKATASMERW